MERPKWQKQILITALAAALLVVVGENSTVFALYVNIKRTPHNLSYYGPVMPDTTDVPGEPVGTKQLQICVYCHTPHNALAAPPNFLWNRIGSNSTFMLYTASPTLNFTKSNLTLGSVSKLCMSCHDGVTAVNSMANIKSGNPDTMTSTFWPDFDGNWGPVIGQGDILDQTNFPGNNLTNDHPVSFTYSQSSAGDATIRAADGPGGSSIGGLPFWQENGSGGWKVECITCHEPHIDYCDANGSYQGPAQTHFSECSPELRPFLRKTNYSSSLCFTCHNK